MYITLKFILIILKHASNFIRVTHFKTTDIAPTCFTKKKKKHLVTPYNITDTTYSNTTYLNAVSVHQLNTAKVVLLFHKAK